VATIANSRIGAASSMMRRTSLVIPASKTSSGRKARRCTDGDSETRQHHSGRQAQLRRERLDRSHDY